MNLNQILKRLTPIVFAIAVVSILVGLVLLVFVVPGAASLFYSVCFIALAVLCLLFGVAVFFLLYLSRDNDPNFFLYDTATARNIDESDLTFDRVNVRMEYFMTTLTATQSRLWTDNVLLTAASDRFGINEVYKPLVAYKMLYDLAMQDSPEAWRLFFTANPAVIDELTDALAHGDEDDMPSKIDYAYQNRDDEWLIDYIQKNVKYLRNRMLRYVRRNMEWFY